MVLGYSTNAFKRFSLEDSIRKIAALGFTGVEIMCDRPHLYPPDAGDEELLSLKSLIAGCNLKITNLNAFTLFAVGDTYLPSWIEPDGARREVRIRHTLECLRVAGLLQCANISVPPGGPLADGSRQEALRLFHAGLEEVIPLAESLKIRILIEPEPGLLLENSRQFKSFIRDVRSPMVGINFDIGHFFCVGEDPVLAFEELFTWIGHVHLEDIAQSRTHEHLIPGKGAISFPEVFRTMKRLGYRGDITLELYPYLDAPEEAGRESLYILRPLLRSAGLEAFD